jgi:transmembrane channel-like protein
MYYLLTDSIKDVMPDIVNKFLDYFVSPAAIIPLLLLLILVIYYLISLTGALREANQDLKVQLHKERTEERKKMMKLMEDKIMQANMANRLSNRWKKALDAGSKANMLPPPITATLTAEESADRKKLLLARAMKNILRKKYSNEDESIPKITTELAEP